MDPTQSYSEICRLCGEKEINMKSLFDKIEPENRQILHVIQECLSIIVYRTDPLSKLICNKCFETLSILYQFKKTSHETAKKYKETLQTYGDSQDNTIQLYLGCEENSKVTEHSSTSTEDLSILCGNCRSEMVGNDEIELCAELHKAITNNGKLINAECDKMLRSRRKRSQAFYHELDDSLCSSLTEFTNTESSQCYDVPSDIDSYESENDSRAAKKRRVEAEPLAEAPEPEQEPDTETELAEAKNRELIATLKELFKDEVEYRYSPLSLMTLCLNVINKQNVPEHEPDDFYEYVFQPRCIYCGERFKNTQLLSLHEIEHMDIELGEKVDAPILWHDSRDDAELRNKWLSDKMEIESAEEDLLNVETIMSVDDGEVGEEEDENENEEDGEESLLIPVGTDVPEEHKTETIEILLMEGKPYVNGVPLADYAKDERKSFYQSLRVGGVNKRFCTLCRYSFKDNWAIESHYFSMACYYTCRYCGMRFNKQRNRYDEHVNQHETNGDIISTQVFAASKNHNIVPKVLFAKRKYGPGQMIPILPKEEIQETGISMINQLHIQQQQQQQQQPQPQLMQQQQTPLQQMQTSQSKTGNQAYFCRKCYKVFFKLDEFNIHSKNCEQGQFPAAKMANMYQFNPHSNNKFSPNTTPRISNGSSSSESKTSSSGRPIRNCAKEAGPYRDEVYIPEALLRETLPVANNTNYPQSYVCYICNTPFPTIYSRNSHMRIHKGDNLNATAAAAAAASGGKNQSPNPVNYRYYKPPTSPPEQHISVAHLAQVKQEPLEPEVEIHESLPSESYSGNLGPAVSITPISRNPNQRPSINPNVMKLVQSNPQLSIKGNNSGGDTSVSPDDNRSYKCSNCWEAFANKSHLYFHKKNQCEGSKYPCPFCKKRFGTEAAYSSHIFYSHPE